MQDGSVFYTIFLIFAGAAILSTIVFVHQAISVGCLHFTWSTFRSMGFKNGA